MFPAMLMEHGEFVLEDNVPANEFLNLEGEKLSTSRGWAVWLHEYLEEFPADTLRYTMASTLPETKDADFSWRDFQARANGELADVLGNFSHRALTFAARYADGKAPPLEEPAPEDLEILDALAEFPARIGQCYETFRNREAVFETMQLARLGNKYFNDREPWRTAKTDFRACANTVHVSLQICAALAVLLEPVLPHSAARLRGMLRLEGVRSSEPGGVAGPIGWDEAAGPLLEAGHELGTSEILFRKIEDAQIAAQLEKLRKRAAEAEKH